MASSGRLLTWTATVAVIAAAAFCGWYFFLRSDQAPPQVNTTTISRGEIVQTVTATGTLQPVTVVDVSSQISGLIQEVLVDFNDRVKAGDVLLRIDPATYESRLRQAEAQLANTEANYRLTKLNHERITELFARNLVSQQERDQAEAQLAQVSAQLQIQQAAVENARVDLSRCTIYAPIDGIVIDRIAEVGRTVAASLNAPTLFTIANDLTKMQISASVAEADIGNVALGQTVQFTVDAFANRTFNGTVTQIRNSPKTEQSVVVYATIISVDNADLRLKPGMTANVSIIVARRPDALRLANAALRVRIPEGMILPPAPAPAGTATAAPAAPAGDPREQFTALLREAGFTPGSGRPSPEVMARVRQLAQQRGIEIPERFGAGGGGGGRNRGGTETVVTRTVYRPVPGEKPRFQPVTVRLGITDGSFTEVLDGLAEGDAVVTSVITGVNSSAPVANPFGGSMRRF